MKKKTYLKIINFWLFENNLVRATMSHVAASKMISTVLTFYIIFRDRIGLKNSKDFLKNHVFPVHSTSAKWSSDLILWGGKGVKCAC